MAAVLIVSSGGATAWGADSKVYPAMGKIERKDPRFDELVAKDAVIERLAEGYDWAEGPVWDKKGQFLLFPDIPPNSVMKWKEGEGVSLFLKPSGYTGSKARGGRAWLEWSSDRF